MKNSIEIVLVLYQCLLEESVTFRSLTEQIQKTTVDYELVIYNNDSNQTITYPKHLVVNSKENVKLPGAYNFALQRAIESGKEWILLLDQDTEIPEDYFPGLDKLFATDASGNLAAVVPVLVSGDKVVSPKLITPNMRFERDLEQTGYTDKRLNAFNSMSLFRVEFIKSIGGFNTDYPLDYHDHWCYHQLYKHKKLVYILDVKANHDSSFVQLEDNISMDRYKEFLATENRFIRNEIGMPVFLFYKIKLILRSLKQILNFKNKKYALITFSSLFR